MATEPTRNDTWAAFGPDAATVLPEWRSVDQQRLDPLAPKEAHNSLAPGVFVGEFEITRTLGEGGFGIVYLAADHSLNRQVAIKEYMPATLAMRAAQGQVNVKSSRLREAFDAGLLGFLNEARLLAFFDHPSLLKVYRFWQANGTAYMAMPYLQGKTLKDTLLSQGEPPPEAWLLGLLAPLTEALQVLHDQHCFHRDIAPDNVMMLAPSQRPLLLDFGAARRVIGDVTQALTVILKPGYAPIEQYGESDGLIQGPWTDVYALGAVVHYAIMGATPPSSASRLLNDTAMPLVQAAAGRYSLEFLTAIDRALAVRPEARTQSMAQLRLELGLAGSPGASASPAPHGNAGAVQSPPNSLPHLTPPARVPTQAAALPQLPLLPPSNLPEQSTRFLGREVEVHEIKTSLRQTRLVTLVGMGGLGKTRLSLQVGAEVLATQPDGVWFLDLSVIREARLVVAHLAQLFDLHDEPGRPLLQTLTAHLKPRKLLLIFDNCEHLLAASAELAHALMRHTADVRILASSREALKVPGEQVYPVLALPLPQPGADLATLLQSTAVRLFVERAQDHKRNFSLTEKDAQAIAELVARVEGIPLALELAAARVRAMSVGDINQRLSDRYKLLNRGSESLHPRQQTLRALVDWSYDMLQDDEKTLLNRLGIFVGGWDMASAEVVCSGTPLNADLVMDLLSSLVEKSLVMMEERDGSSRYRMLETLRDYALEKLHASAEASATAAAHGQHYFALSKQIREGLKGKDQGLWIRHAESDIDNLRAAMALGLGGGMDSVITVKMAVALQGFWVLRGHMTEGRAIVREALQKPEVQAFAVAHAHALYVGAALALMQSDFADAMALLTQCLALRRQSSAPGDIAATLSTLAKVQLRMRHGSEPSAGVPDQAGWPGLVGSCDPQHAAQQARASASEALALLDSVGDKVGEAIALQDLGQIEFFTGDFVAARHWIERSLDSAKRLKHQEVEAECERILGEIAFEEEREDEARQRLARASQICAAAGDRRGAACVQLWQGKLALKCGDLPQAKLDLGQALTMFQASSMRAEWIDGLLAIAGIAALDQAWIEALKVVTAVTASTSRAQMAMSQQALLRFQKLVALIEARLDSEAIQDVKNASQGWDAAITTAVALKICA